MQLSSPNPFDNVQCYVCGYDLRAHPDEEGVCPECGTSIAESRRLALIPRRPAWRDSDPRWRRRMLAGVWVLLLLPLPDLLKSSDWISNLPSPDFFHIYSGLTLGQSMAAWDWFTWPIIFCVGVVLLFSKERGRRPGKLDWTRRWGILCSYVSFLLCIAPLLFIGALVLVGISMLFFTLPIKSQPPVNTLFVNVSTAWLRYGPQPKEAAYFVRVISSSLAMLFGCVPLFNALRSTGGKRIPFFLLTPLVLLALVYIFEAAVAWIAPAGSSLRLLDIDRFDIYFRPGALTYWLVGPDPFTGPDPTTGMILIESTKWFLLLTIAIRLSIAQLAAGRKRDVTAV